MLLFDLIKQVNVSQRCIVSFIFPWMFLWCATKSWRIFANKLSSIWSGYSSLDAWISGKSKITWNCGQKSNSYFYYPFVLLQEKIKKLIKLKFRFFIIRILYYSVEAKLYVYLVLQVFKELINDEIRSYQKIDASQYTRFQFPNKLKPNKKTINLE